MVARSRKATTRHGIVLMFLVVTILLMAGLTALNHRVSSRVPCRFTRLRAVDPALLFLTARRSSRKALKRRS
jgi:hypothetical protein